MGQTEPPTEWFQMSARSCCTDTSAWLWLEGLCASLLYFEHDSYHVRRITLTGFQTKLASHLIRNTNLKKFPNIYVQETVRNVYKVPANTCESKSEPWPE